MTTGHRQRAVLVLAVAGALLLVMQWSWGRTLWLDEEMIAINLRDRSVGELASPLSLAQAAPYGWLVLERFMLLAFGSGERALRFLPMAFGVGTLATAVWIGRRWMTTVGAASLVFLCSTGQWISFYPLELKHYSADACFGLLLPALAVWATEPDGNSGRRVLAWWVVAAAAQWVANGALFVTPPCAVVLVLVAARRSGWRAGLAATAPGLIWLVSFALNYRLTLAPALSSNFLRGYWANAFPPEAVGMAANVVETTRWLASRLAPLALKPGGSRFGLAFWGASALGFLLTTRYSPAFRLSFALVPVLAFVWAGIRLVPMLDRLSLWMVPAVYVGIAAAAEVCIAAIRNGHPQVRLARIVLGSAAFALILTMCADIFMVGTTYVALRPYVDNHGFDDRAGISWLARQRRPGDVWLASYLTMPAIWWYAGPAASTPMVEASFESKSSSCGSQEIAAWADADRPRRILAYLGFGHDMPEEYDETVVQRLSSLGRVTAYRPFQTGHALIVDLSGPSVDPVTLASLSGRSTAVPAPAAGCISVAPGRQW